MTMLKITTINPIIELVMVSLAVSTCLGSPAEVERRKAPKRERSRAKPPARPMANLRKASINPAGVVGIQPNAV